LQACSTEINKLATQRTKELCNRNNPLTYLDDNLFGFSVIIL